MSTFTVGIQELVNDLTSAEKTNILNAILTQTFEVSDIQASHTVLTGVRKGQLLPIITPDDYYGKLAVGNEKSCDLNGCTVTPDYSAHVWSMAEYNCRQALCMRNFDEDFFIFWNGYRQRLENPLELSPEDKYLAYIIENSKNALNGAAWRTAYWGDTNDANTLISGNDGFLAQADAGSGIKVTKTIPLAATMPTGKEIYEALEDAYQKAGAKFWSSKSDLVWKMPWQIAQIFVTFLNTAADRSMYNCDCINPGAVVGSRNFFVEGLTVFGIPVEAHREIDGGAAAISATAADKRWVILAPKSNLLIGANTEETIKQFDIFFDKVSRKVYIDLMAHLGAGIPTADYVYVTFPNGN
jgi:hypothetical protein